MPFIVQDDTTIRFSADHRWEALSEARFGQLARELSAWREIIALAEPANQASGQSGSAGHRHVSAREGAMGATIGFRSFIVSGTKSSRVKSLKLAHYAYVESYDYTLNRVNSHGEMHPPSEALMHAALYDASPSIRCVFHAYSPRIWRAAADLQLPATDSQVDHGAPEIGQEVRRIFRETDVRDRGIFRLAGHKDGVIVFGRDTDDAGSVFMSCLAKAMQLT